MHDQHLRAGPQVPPGAKLTVPLPPLEACPFTLIRESRRLGWLLPQWGQVARSASAIGIRFSNNRHPLFK